jgi:hypothetical protein
MFIHGRLLLAVSDIFWKLLSSSMDDNEVITRLPQNPVQPGLGWVLGQNLRPKLG